MNACCGAEVPDAKLGEVLGNPILVSLKTDHASECVPSESPHDLGQVLVDFAASVLGREIDMSTPALAQRERKRGEQVIRAAVEMVEGLVLHRTEHQRLLDVLERERAAGRAPATQFDKLAVRAEGAKRAAATSAETLLSTGLHQRIGGFLTARDRYIVDLLIELGARPPHASGEIWVCRECGFVWVPEGRKRVLGRAPRCERCAKRPTTLWRYSEHADRRGHTTTHTTGETVHMRDCAVCAGHFKARHAAQEVCSSDRCRKALQRRRAAGLPIADPEAAEILARLDLLRDDPTACAATAEIADSMRCVYFALSREDKAVIRG